MLPKWHKILMFILPFSNEIANALTISHTLKDTPFKRLYKPCDEDITKKIESSLIDALALIGICWNVAYMGSKHGTKMGLLYGCVVLSLSFIIPNLAMEPIVNDVFKAKTNLSKLVVSMIFILILLSLEIYSSNYLKSMDWKHKVYR